MKDQEIKAVLQAQTALLIALAKTTPHPEQVLQIFGILISNAIDAEPDPQVGGILQTLEESYRRSIGQQAGRSG
jgi:hypothetical protein